MTTPIDATIAWYERAKATATALRTDDPAYAAAADDLAAAHACLVRTLRARQAAYRTAAGPTYAYRAAEDSVVVLPRLKRRRLQQGGCHAPRRTPDPREAARQDYVRQAAADRAAWAAEKSNNRKDKR